VTVTWYHTGVVMCCCSSANKCLLKVAQYSAQRELFEKAAEIYEQVSVLCKFVSSTISDRAVYFYSFHRVLPMYCRRVWALFADVVVCSSAAHQWTVRCSDTVPRITSFVQQSAACVRIFKMVRMLLANMNRCVLHLRILENVNCWRLVHFKSTFVCHSSVIGISFHWYVIKR